MRVRRCFTTTTKTCRQLLYAPYVPTLTEEAKKVIRKAQMRDAPVLHSKLHDHCRGLVHSNPAPRLEKSANRQVQLEVTKVLQAAFGNQYTVQDISAYNYALQVISIPLELAVVDTENPKGFVKDVPNPVPRIYSHEAIADALTAAGYTGHFLAPTCINTDQPGPSARGKTLTTPKYSPIEWPWPTYTPPASGDPSYPVVLKVEKDNKTFFLSPPSPLHTPLLKLMQSYFKVSSDMQTSFSVAWLWARSLGLNIRPIVIALTIIAYMQAERGLECLQHHDGSKLLQTDSVWILRERVSLAEPASPPQKELVCGAPQSVEVETSARYQHKIFRYAKVGSIFQGWLESFSNQVGTFMEKRDIVSVRNGAPLRRSTIWRKRGEEDENERLYRLYYGAPEPPLNIPAFRPPSLWNREQFIVQDPFVFTYNHAGYMKGEDYRRFAHYCTGAAARLRDDYALGAVFGTELETNTPLKNDIVLNVPGWTPTVREPTPALLQWINDSLVKRTERDEEALDEATEKPLERGALDSEVSDLRKAAGSEATAHAMPSRDRRSRDFPVGADSEGVRAIPSRDRHWRTVAVGSDMASSSSLVASHRTPSPLGPGPGGSSSFHTSACRRNLSESLGPTPNDYGPEANLPFSEQLWRYYKGRRPVQETLEVRRQTVGHLRRLVAGFNTAIQPSDDTRRSTAVYGLLTFGSTRYGVDDDTSDLDLVVLDPERPQGYAPGVQLVSRPPIYDMKILANYLRKAGGFRPVVAIQNARIPIVKSVSRLNFNLAFDMNVNDQLGLHNTQLLSAYTRMLPLVRPMIYIIKRWAKACGINDVKPGRQTKKRGNTPALPTTVKMFNSYCLALMVVGWLQIQGLLPNLQAPFVTPLKRTVYSLTPGKLFDVPYLVARAPPPAYPGEVWWMKAGGVRVPCDVRFVLEPDGWDRRPKRDMTLQEALEGWFRFWWNEFPYKEYALSIRDGGMIARPLPEPVVRASRFLHEVQDDVEHGEDYDPQTEAAREDEQQLEREGDSLEIDRRIERDLELTLAEPTDTHGWVLNPMVVADPFDRTRNVTKALDKKSLVKFRAECERAQHVVRLGLLEELVGRR